MESNREEEGGTIIDIEFTQDGEHFFREFAHIDCTLTILEAKVMCIQNLSSLFHIKLFFRFGRH